MSTPSPPINLHDSVGALQLGSLFAVFLFGVVTLQSHLYYQQFRNDKIHLKALVALVWILELGHTFCIAAEIYKATIIHYGRPDKLFPFPYLGASTAVGGSIAFLAHTFFSSRVWKVLPKPWNFIGVFCFVLALARFIGSALLGSKAVKATVLEHYRRDWGWLIVTLLMGGAAIDIIIAGSMLSYLHSQREKVFARSVRLIDRLVQYTICTSLVPSLSAVIMVICFHVKPTAMIWIAVYICLAKLYSNCILASLNSRADLRSTPSQSGSLDPSSKPTKPSRHNTDANLSISIEMNSTVHTTTDGGDYVAKQYPIVHTPTSTAGWNSDSVHRMV
ncbi:hypothetical protein CC2G_002797 [Coprinopsis cinerea AmutBmut pab1-1]|nr:hypothetical protein CC2G_002797 [Coprinopsis cinerea AmutBmut pab1-1]